MDIRCGHCGERHQSVALVRACSQGKRKPTLAEAQEHGRRTGRCLVCSRKLTHPESVAAGIGPVCAGKL